MGDRSLIVEVSGEARKDKAAKVTTRTLWLPAVNNHGGSVSAVATGRPEGLHDIKMKNALARYRQK